MKAELQRVEQELAAAESRRSELLDRVPAPPDASAPDGFTDDDAVELRRVGEQPSFSFEPRDHLELARIDTERGAKVSGSRFVYRVGAAAQLELALYRFALDRLNAKGFAHRPPARARARGRHVRHRLPPDRRGQPLPRRTRRAVPHRHVRGRPGRHARRRGAGRRRAPAPATRAIRRASAARPAPPGRTRAACSASISSTRSRCSSSRVRRARRDMHDFLLATEEELVAELGLPYRVVNIAAGDLGASASKKYDIEAWFPGPGPLPRDHLDLEHDRLPVAAPGHSRPRRAGPRVRAHAERNGRDRTGHDRRAGELPGRGRRRRGTGSSDGVRRPGPHRARGLTGLHSAAGGVPERSKGAVLKIARR